MIAALILGRQKPTAEHGLDAEQGKETRRDTLPRHLLGLARARQIGELNLPRGELRKDLALLAPRRAVEWRGRVFGQADLRDRLPHDYQSLRVLIGQPLPQDGVDDGEDRGVGADA